MTNKGTNNSIVRFITCGSVDDGKSTLIGRLLYDTKSIFDDQYSELKSVSDRKGNSELDLSLLTDGLKEERERGITIDVAYRYFSTPKRKFIIADTPGHKEFTRNMITGASTASIAILMIDSRHGITEQTMRHSYINSVLRIPHVIVCVNKMDLCEYQEERFLEIKNDFQKRVQSLVKFEKVDFIPISALKGDNVTTNSIKMPWYKGETLLSVLEKTDQSFNFDSDDFKFAVQSVFHLSSNEKIIFGRVLGGELSGGEKITVCSTGERLTVDKIQLKGDDCLRATSGQSLSLFVNGKSGIRRGDILLKKEVCNMMSDEIECVVCWLSDKPAQKGSTFIIQTLNQSTLCEIKEIMNKTEINSLSVLTNVDQLKANDIGKIKIKIIEPTYIDRYIINKNLGSFILIDTSANETVCGGIVL